MMNNKTIPTKKVMEYLRNDDAGMCLVADMKKVKKDQKLTAAHTLAVAGHVEYEKFVKEIEEISGKLKTRVRVKTILILE